MIRLTIDRGIGRVCNLINSRLFTVLYFSVRSSRSNALRYGLPSWMSVKTPPKAIIPDARPLGTCENQDGRHCL